MASGPSHIQAVTFDANGPGNCPLLPISQDTDPARAPHLNDQAGLFAQKHWVCFPFNAAEIAADPKRTPLEFQAQTKA